MLVFRRASVTDENTGTTSALLAPMGVNASCGGWSARVAEGPPSLPGDVVENSIAVRKLLSSFFWGASRLFHKPNGNACCEGYTTRCGSLLGDETVEVEGRATESQVDPDGRGVAEDLPDDPVTEVPQVPPPRPLGPE